MPASLPHPVSRPANVLAGISAFSLALLCIAPFLWPYHRHPFTSFYSEWIALICGLGVCLVMLRRDVWQAHRIPGMALGLAVTAVLIALRGSDGWISASGAAFVLIWASALIVAVRMLRDIYGLERMVMLVAGAMVCGATLGSLVGVVQYYEFQTPLNPWIVKTPANYLLGNIGQRNHYSSQLAVGLFGLLLLGARGRPHPAWLCIPALPMLWALTLSGSRSSWVFLGLAVVLAFFVARRNAPEQAVGRRLLVLTVILVATAVLMTVVLTWGGSAGERGVTPFETNLNRLIHDPGSTRERLVLWPAAWQTILAHPWFGAGWGAFPWEYFRFVADSGPGDPFRLFHHAHNIGLHLAAELGLVGAGIVLAPILFWFYRQFRESSSVLRWWALVIAGVLAWHSLIEFPLWYAYFLGILAVVTGLFPGYDVALKSSVLWRPLAAAGVALSAVALVVLMQDYREFERAFFQLDSGQSIRSERGEMLPQLLQRLHRNPVLAPYTEVVTALPVAAGSGDAAAHLFFNERAMRYVPFATLVYRQALLLALNDRPAEAVVMLRRARRAYPVQPPEFDRELAALARRYPARRQPLLELTAPGATAPPP
jgi:O-antigen ligase